MATLSNNKLEDWEIAKYWEIFSGLNPQNGMLSGDRAATVLKNSKLDDSQLEKIWDLADVDNDGNLDFEEFCVAMRIIFDVINGRYRKVPDSLPDWLIPSSKAHLVAANSALKTGSLAIEPMHDDDFDDAQSGLSNDFDWYMSPRDKGNYDAIYTANANHHGQITFESLSELYGTLNVPESDINSAWNLINPRSDRTIGKDQTLAFLHILNNRDKGVRVPRNIPPSLRATFEKNTEIDYDLSSTPPPSKTNSTFDRNTSSGKKSAFAESYLERLGISSGARKYSPSGTDFSATKDTDWEEVRLRRRLTELESQLEKADAAAKRRKEDSRIQTESSKVGLVRTQLEQLYDYKRRQLRRLRSGDNDIHVDVNLTGMKQEIEVLKQQVELFDDYCNRKQSELNQLYAEIEREK
ncbi:actin cytoskeleton-regulatory complex protein END3-domain-containing protein [Lipomyces tetrasporus]|uniref:Actin cytoskeleton-regulatory complex protein END3 n=1 Tax=Lipomyces tetrasporus TaxID=54092 RepID=A0AAD7VRW6_9ASCO|nr:actin cytoskeleton-regulatory complex protein END3-domain-containing protein [Lipomyces tetrasporus]KAJ8099114.1 actin cytoskeleton-regulatory complex protein END3-domain-containing protein [Lipomyces tetrasporus]